MPIMRTLSVVAVLLAAALALAEAKGGDWSKPYTPTKLEWLEMTLQAHATERCSPRETQCIGVTYQAVPPETIVIHLQPGPDVPISKYDEMGTSAHLSVQVAATDISKSPIKIEIRRKLYP